MSLIHFSPFVKIAEFVLHTSFLGRLLMCSEVPDSFTLRRVFVGKPLRPLRDTAFLAWKLSLFQKHICIMLLSCWVGEKRMYARR